MAEERIPLSREEVEVGKRRVETGGVLVRKLVHEETVPVEVDLVDETVEIRRVPIGRLVEEPVADRYEGDTLIVSVMEEVLVVERRQRVVEEVHITRTSRQHRHREEQVVRREEAVVRRQPPESGA
ncbi:MAG: YsnF/AvaK domain-containing protein [Rhodospirillales bacterium]|nr:YsnF/AvaK domain-containing protein [Rhodospirillales bacterium]